MMYVMLIRGDGQQLATKGPFAEADTNRIYDAIEEIERVYRPSHGVLKGDECSTVVLRVAHVIRHEVAE